MFGWLKKIVRRWLAEDEPPVTALDCIVDGRCRRMAVGQAFGTRLQVYDGHAEYLIDAAKAVDRRQFWKAWEQRKGPDDLVWEDGTPFDPTEVG